ncbi:hypothetical protein F2P81_019165 [Scophthalmus maximus]|uniref:Uncharacterized protein n=1 Tax=Scophthalmus maximus TaxID=52904 RepID=A0A6A4S785_SCOMX|nr:hypothetical protein F2P81_019165 [Scophthalmus maximus]
MPLRGAFARIDESLVILNHEFRQVKPLHWQLRRFVSFPWNCCDVVGKWPSGSGELFSHCSICSFDVTVKLAAAVVADNPTCYHC